MAYTKTTWLHDTVMTTGLMNHAETQYTEGHAYLLSHNHNTLYYTMSQMDARYWYAGNDGTGSGTNADLMEYGNTPLDAEDFATLGSVSGLIIMWGGAQAAIPTGWVLADGENGTHDMRDKFVEGAGNTNEDYIANETANDTLVLLRQPTVGCYLKISVSGGTANTGTVNINGTELFSFSGAGSQISQYTYDEIAYISTTGMVDEATKPTVTVQCVYDTYGTIGTGANTMEGVVTVSEHILTIAEVIGHVHGYNDKYGATWTSRSYDFGGVGNAVCYAQHEQTSITSYNVGPEPGEVEGHTHTGPTFTGDPVHMLGPYYALCFIQKVAEA